MKRKLEIVWSTIKFVSSPQLGEIDEDSGVDHIILIAEGFLDQFEGSKGLQGLSKWFRIKG